MKNLFKNADIALFMSLVIYKLTLVLVNACSFGDFMQYFYFVVSAFAAAIALSKANLNRRYTLSLVLSARLLYFHTSGDTTWYFNE
jgi:hypothetical protein